jgi:hypothetical protein
MNILVVISIFVIAFVFSKNTGADSENIDTLGPYVVFFMIAYFTSQIFICNFEYVAMILMHCNLIDQNLQNNDEQNKTFIEAQKQVEKNREIEK